MQYALCHLWVLFIFFLFFVMCVYERQFICFSLLVLQECDDFFLLFVKMLKLHSHERLCIK